MEVRHLKYFVMVAEELHFSRAAARLEIAVPTLSHQIRALESELGAQLFRRKTRSAVALTHVGRRFLDEAHATLKQMEHTELVGRRAARGETGSIALGYVLSACCSGLLAAALVGHRLASRKQVSAAAIAEEPLIAAPLEMEPGFWGNLVSVNPTTPLNIVQRAPDAITMLALVAAGLGLGVVSGSLSRIAVPGVVYRDIVGASRKADHAVVYRRNESAPVVNAFLKSLRQDFRG